MTSNLGFSLIEQRLITGNPYNYYSNLKYLDEASLMQHFQLTFQAKTQSEIYGVVLKAAQKKDVSALLDQKSPQYLTPLEIALRALNKQGYIQTKYKYKFNSRRQVTDLVIEGLTIQDLGLDVLKRRQALKDIDYPSTYRAFILQAKRRIDEVDILEVSKEELIEFFESVERDVTAERILDFRHDRIRDLTFDLYTGKIIIRNKEAFKKFVDSNTVPQLEIKLKDFIRETVDHMTESKIIIQALLKDDFEMISYFMSNERLVKHLGYLSDYGLVRLDFSYDMAGEIKNIKIHRHQVTPAGEAYLKSRALLKVKHRMMGRQLAMMLKTFAKEKEQKKALEGNALLKDLIASEHLH